MTENKFDIKSFLTEVVKMGVSDIHLRVNMPPSVRKNGEIKKLKLEPITEKQLGEAISVILPKELRSTAQCSYDLDFSYEIDGVSRFRVNLCRQLGKTALVLRIVPLIVKNISELNLPQSLLQFTELNNGIVLVTGPTGSGKSTTLATLLQTINLTKSKHIITIEDPIEYVYEEKNSLITQRQIGLDIDNFAEGVKYSMRQDPDIILIGEIRDRATMESALKASETGHLVFATLHTNDAIQTVNRVMNLFEPENREYIRYQLAQNLRGTVAQKLVPKKDGKGRIPACEVMVVTPTVKDLITKNELESIYDLVKRGSYNDMLTLNMSLHLLCRSGIITKETALAFTDKENELQQMFKGVYHGTMKRD